jgi:hypothetical protein
MKKHNQPEPVLEAAPVQAQAPDAAALRRSLRQEREGRPDPSYLEYRRQLGAEEQIKRLEVAREYFRQNGPEIRQLAYALLQKYPYDENEPTKVREAVVKLRNFAHGAINNLDTKKRDIPRLITDINDSELIRKMSASVSALVNIHREEIARLAGCRDFAEWAEHAKILEDELAKAVEHEKREEAAGRGTPLRSTVAPAEFAVVGGTIRNLVDDE